VCCGGGGSQPSHGTSNHHKHKRDVDLRRKDQLLFPQTDLDKMYCPGNLHAWYVLLSIQLGLD
jgi:hypothetical protein